MTPIDGYILPILTSILAGYLLTYLQPKARIYYWSPHFFRFRLPNENNIEIQTDSLTIQNMGRKSAEDIEIILTHRPDHFQFQPPLEYSEELRADSFIIKLTRLVPKEYITLQLLNYRTSTPLLQTIRFSSGIAKNMPFQINRVFSKWLYSAMWILLLLGTYFSILKLVQLTYFIIKLTDLT